MGKFSGRDLAVESVAALLFTFLNNLDRGLKETEDMEQTKKSSSGSGASGPDDILVDKEGETLGMK